MSSTCNLGGPSADMSAEPNGWSIKKLATLVNVVYGKSPAEIEKLDNGIPIFGTGGVVGYTSEVLCDGPSVILGRKGTIDKVQQSAGPFWAIDTTYYTTPKQEFDWSWLYYAISSFDLRKMNEASGVPSLSRSSLEALDVATPPLPEQQKIAAILTTVDDKLDIIARQIEATQTLKQGLMQTLFSRGVGTQDSNGHWVPHTKFKDSELGEIPVGWAVLKLREVVRSFAGGTPDRSKPEYFGGDIPWVKSGEVNRKTVSYAEESITPLAVEKTSVRIAEKGAILVAMYGATAGKVSRLMLDAGINQAILSIRSISAKFTNDFLYWSICNQTERMLAMCQGAAQPNLSKGLIESLIVAVPDLQEQMQISQTLFAVENKLDALVSKQSHYQTLKRGLMQKLLTGEWRVKVDETPAAVV